MDREPQTYDELKAKYLAVKKRLGGVSGPTGVVPIERVTLPQESKILEDAPVLQVRLHNRKFATMLREVAAMHGIDPNIVRSPTIRADVVKVRREVFYRAKNELNLAYSEIGRLMDVRHSTVIYGIKKYQKGIASRVKNC
jgi:chromosomal replication initiation ATPase DnaA